MTLATPTSIGFKNLMKIIMVDVHIAENQPLNVPLIASFMIVTLRLEKAKNVAI